MLTEAEVAALALSLFPGLTFNEVTKTMNVINLHTLIRARIALSERVADERRLREGRTVGQGDSFDQAGKFSGR